MKIAYNAGHILSTAGKRIPKELDAGETREWVLNDRIARYFAREMAAYAGVELRRLDDPLGQKSIDIDARVAQANLWPADFYLSIHHNAAGKIFSGGGVEVYLDAPGGPSEAYARSIYEEVVKATGLKGDRADPIRTGDETPLYETRATAMPAVLVETAFIDNKADSLLLKNSTADFAEAICEGITGKAVQKEETAMAQTVMELKGSIFVQEIVPSDFKIYACDKTKKNINMPNYFNCGYFTYEGKGTAKRSIPVGNLAIEGKIIAQSKDQGDWINVAKKKLTTIN